MKDQLKNGDFAAYQLEEVVINGDYLRLNGGADTSPENCAPMLDNYGDNNCSMLGYSRSRRFWLNVLVICAIFSVVVGVLIIIKHYGSDFIYKEVILVISWLTKIFSPLVLAAIVFAALALFPSIMLPTTPVKWVAGMTFGYGVGFLLIIAGLAVGVSLPYSIGSHLFLPKIKAWLDKHPRQAAIVRLAGDGDWFHQFRATVLIRVAPVTFLIFNYTAVATGVQYGPYLAGSLLGLMPDIFVAICSGILIRAVAEAMEEHTQVSKLQLILDGIGLCITVVAAFIIGFYAKRKLEQLQERDEEEQLI